MSNPNDDFKARYTVTYTPLSEFLGNSDRLCNLVCNLHDLGSVRVC